MSDLAPLLPLALCIVVGFVSMCRRMRISDDDADRERTDAQRAAPVVGAQTGSWAMSDMDFSRILDALRTPQPPTLQPPARPAAPSVAVGAGAYRTAHIAPDVMPLPRPPWWVRAQAIVLAAIIGRRRAAFRLHILGASTAARLVPKVRAMLRMSPEELRVLGARLQAAVEARRDEIAGLS